MAQSLELQDRVNESTRVVCRAGEILRRRTFLVILHPVGGAYAR